MQGECTIYHLNLGAFREKKSVNNYARTIGKNSGGSGMRDHPPIDFVSLGGHDFEDRTPIVLPTVWRAG